MYDGDDDNNITLFAIHTYVLEAYQNKLQNVLKLIFYLIGFLPVE